MFEFAQRQGLQAAAAEEIYELFVESKEREAEEQLLDPQIEHTTGRRWLVAATLGRLDCDFSIHRTEKTETTTYYLISVSVRQSRQDGMAKWEEGVAQAQKLIRAGKKAMQAARSDPSQYSVALSCFEGAWQIRLANLRWTVRRRFTDFEKLRANMPPITAAPDMPGKAIADVEERKIKFDGFVKAATDAFKGSADQKFSAIVDFLYDDEAVVADGITDLQPQLTVTPAKRVKSGAKVCLDAEQWKTIAQIQVHITRRDLPAAAAWITAALPEHRVGMNLVQDSRELREALRQALDANHLLTTEKFEERQRHVEAARKMQFGELTTAAGAHLTKRGAVPSLSEARQARCLADNEEEKLEATTLIKKATVERDQQKRVKEQMQSAIRCLEDADPETAWKHSKDALAIEEDPTTNEHMALDYLQQACAFLIAGNEALEAWHGEDAKKSFVSATESASAAAATAESDGYFEYESVLLELSTGAMEMLRERWVRRRRRLSARPPSHAA